MAEPLPPDYERTYLDLLYDYQSDDTKKTRRNLAVASFIVIAIHLAGVPVSKLKLPYVDSGDTDTFVVVVLAIVLLLYWSVSLGVHTIRDYHVQKERRHQLENIGKDIDQELERLRKEREKTTPSTFQALYGARKGSLERSRGIITTQRERTRRASWWNVVTRNMEYIIAVLMALGAFIFLVFDLVGCTVAGC